MRLISWNSVTALLLEEEPNMAFSYELQAELPTDVVRGLTAIEARTPRGDTLRLSVGCTVTLETAQQVTKARNALQSLGANPVLLPLWVAKRAPGDTHPVSASWWAVAEPGVDVVVYATGSLPGSYAADTWIAPVMVGWFADTIDPQSLSDQVAQVELKFVESSAYSLTLDSYSAAGGITVGGVTPKVFPWRPDWSEAPTGQGARVSIDRQSIGFSRESADAFFSQPSARVERRKFTLSGSEPWQFLRFFLDHGGNVSPIWLQGANSETDLTLDVGASDTKLTVADPTARGLNSFVMLDDGTNRALCKVTSTSGSDWNLSAAVGIAFSKADTLVNSLMLSRFSRPKLTLRFTHDELAEAQVEFTEVPWEIGTIAGETIGTTMGAVVTKGYIYTFTIAIPGATQTYRFTSFERDLTYSSNTYTAKPFEHGDIRESLGLERQTVTIKSRSFTGNPLGMFLPFTLEFPLMLEICEVDVSGSTGSNPWCVFYGEVTKVQTSGPYLTATAEAIGAILNRKIPRKLLQPTCNWTVFDSACGLARASWKWDSLSVSWTGSTYTLRVNTITKGGVAQTGLAQHHFAGGMVIIGTGASVQYRWIADNAAQSGSNLDLILATPLPTAPSAGTAVEFYPGCDGRFETCSSKFANKANFGGFPYMPTGNPSLAKVSKNLSSGGKK